jgi:hypothetical protein
VDRCAAVGDRELGAVDAVALEDERVGVARYTVVGDVDDLVGRSREGVDVVVGDETWRSLSVCRS